MELIDRYQQAAMDLLFKARTTQRENIEKVGKIVAEAVEGGHKIYLGKICHDIEMDLFNRGGGPAFYQLYKEGETELKPGDVLFVSSVSGRTAKVVDLAYKSMQEGIKVIALTSLVYAQAVEPVHESGKRLHEFVTAYLDNCAPAAEAMLEVDGLEARFAAASGLASCFIMWSVTAIAVETMLKDGYTPGVFMSINFPGGKEFYDKAIEHYKEFGW